MQRGPLDSYADALLCAVAVLLVEWLMVGMLSLRQLAGPYELYRVLFSLVPFAVVAALPAALGGALLLLGTDEPTSTRGRLLVTVPALLLAVFVAIGVSSGRLLAGARRPLFVAAVVIVAGLLAWFGCRPLARLLGWLRRRGWPWLSAASVLAVAALELANALIFPRLYLAFHGGMALLTLWVAALASGGWRSGARARLRRRVVAAIVVVSGAAAVGAPQRMSLYDNIRFVYLERAPLLSHALRLSALVAPPPPMDADGSVGAATAAGETVDFSGRDLLFVSIDALRADHVGAYGYERDVTPQLDALAADGVVFEAAYTATPHTSYALTSLMTGKYMRPLLLQGVGMDSQTWAGALRRYDYRTAAFFPPAAFFIDRERFTSFEKSSYGFEYSKVQFSSAAERVGEVEAYLQMQPADARQMLWVHMFEPHEPYVRHPQHDFGGRSIDRYDSEIAYADAALGELVRLVRKSRPRTVVIVTADHGEEFGDHGGRYHGTTVYDEQVRVPLVFNAPGLLAPRRVSAAVGLVDLMPTVLAAMAIPASPRVRGRDLGPLLAGGAGGGKGFAFSETDEHTMLASGSLRLVCARRIGACRLYDVAADPAQKQDVSAAHMHHFGAMKKQLAGFVSSLGRFEAGDGARNWPRALRRGIAGDVDAAMDVAALIDDADVNVRRKAAEVLFALRRDEVAVHLRRALQRDEDGEVRTWCALALTRLGQGAPLVFDLLDSNDPRWRRLAALTLAEAGDARGEQQLIDWWRSAYPQDPGDASETLTFERAREIAAALARIRSKRAVGPLAWGLRDVRLRTYVAEALLAIGDKAARPALGHAFAVERYHHARVALAKSLVALGGGLEMRLPLIRFLGVPDPLTDGLQIAQAADVLEYVGGPRERELRRLRRFATSGVTIGLVVPESEHATDGLRVIVRARSTDAASGEVRFGLTAGVAMRDGDRSYEVPKQAPRLEQRLTVVLSFEPGGAVVERHAQLPAGVADRVGPGQHGDFVVYATQNVAIESCAVVPLSAEMPPPAPKPWQKTD